MSISINEKIKIFEFAITPPVAAITSGKCISGKLTFDCILSQIPQGKGCITQIELIEYKAAGSFQAINTALYITAKDFTAATAGNTFDSDIDEADKAKIKGFIPLSGTYTELGTDYKIQINPLSFYFENDSSRAMYGQLVAQASATYDASAKLLLRVHVKEL